MASAMTLQTPLGRRVKVIERGAGRPDVLFDDRRLSIEALAELTTPVLVVEGTASTAVDRAICTVIRRHVPQARHTLIEGAGHMMPLTHSEPLTRALLKSARL
jgi:pimeloyl-ACP methyl ester carboxylesterase